MEGKHFVLVHGAGHGAWTWYKVSSLLKKAGHRVTALDMAASGIDARTIDQARSFEQYSEPLLDFMASLSPDEEEEKVVLVGHSLGGLNLALAMERFPRKISAAVFVTALVPDTINQPSHVLDKFFESIPEGGWLDTQFLAYGSEEDPLRGIILGSQFCREVLYSLSPIEDLELFMALRRPATMFHEDLKTAKKFSKEGYGSVRRVYVICKEDKGITEAFARWMIENSGIQEVREVEGADHMPMFSQPQRLCDCLVELTGV